MNTFSSEILLSIFKFLDSKDKVIMRRVCRKWLEVIDENQLLWRQLVLSRKDDGCDLSTLELFDEKSASGLTEVSVKVDVESEEVKPFISILEKSKETLRFLSIFKSEKELEEKMAETSLNFPRLVECKIRRATCERVQVISGWNKDPDAAQSLKVLWLPSPRALSVSSPQLLKGLSSLSLDSSRDPLEWRAMLEEPSLTLVHLNMHVYDNSTPDDIPRLNFPRLKCLEIWTTSDKFPSWMTIPSSGLIMTRKPMTSLPSVSTLWLCYLQGTGLSARCPILSELRIDRYGVDKSTLRELSSMLRQRKQNVEAGMEIDGVRMVSLKTLTFDMDKIKPSVIQELSDLVEEVRDLETSSAVVKIEI